MPDPDNRLRELLDTEPPPGVAALSAADQERLADLIVEARRGQARSLEQSFEATLKHVPLPVRRIVKKVLSG